MQQAITWTSVDPDLYRHMASLGHNELITNHRMAIVSGITAFPYGCIRHIVCVAQDGIY